MMTTRIEHDSPDERRLRVLVVDNKPIDRNDHEADLREWGYLPILAEGEGKALIEDAKRKAREYRCHAAIVDMRLFDDRDVSDRSGLNLVPYLKPAKCIMVTGYGTVATSRTANEYRAVMVGKEEGSDAVRAELETALQDVRRTDFSIEPPDFLEKHVVPHLRSDERHPVQVDEVRDVLKMLFTHEGQIYLQDLPRSVPSTPTTASGLHGSSVVIRVTPYKLASAIIKLASPNAIRRECKNYDTYIVERFRNRRHPHISRRKRFWNVGAVVYTSLGEDINDIAQFGTYFRSHTPSEITAALRDFFLHVWHPLYIDQSDLSGSLFEAYERLWARPDSGGPLTARLVDWKRLDKSRSFEGLQGDFPEPRRWLADHATSSSIPNARQCIVHGDLHGRNFFVDRHGNTWVIDFERTGPGHILADFVELEHDILRELAGKLDLPTLLHVTVGLVTPLSIDRKAQDDPLQFTNSIPTLVKAVGEPLRNEVERVLRTIHELRKIALELLGYEEQQEYYWALLLDTLFGVQQLERQPKLGANDEAIRQRELLIASVLCQRLRNGDVVWPPSGWKQINVSHEQRDLPARTPLQPAEPCTYEFDVFLCHNSADKPEIKEIGLMLNARGIRPWLDEWELQPGLPWQDALEAHIPNIRSAAVFVGSNGTGPWQAVEIAAFLREFVQRRCPVIPVMLGSAPKTPSLPTFLKGMHWVDFRKKEPDPLDQLIFGITGKKPA